LTDVVGQENIGLSEAELLCYSYDASLAAAKPCSVIHFQDISQISPVIKILASHNISFTPRAAGTNLCGAAVNMKGGVILNLAKLKKIRQIDTVSQIAVVDPGIVNLQLQNELAKYGFFYAPDPASQKVCTIGGNISQNAGGPQCLKYGVTCDHIEKLEVVLPDGSERIFSRQDPGPDLVSLFCQSEGTLGVIKTAWLRILPMAKKITALTCFFKSVEDSMNAVSTIIAEGIIPRALEEVDALSIKAGAEKEEIPQEAEALLIVELEDANEAIEKKVLEIFSSSKGFSYEITSDPDKREKLWKIRKESYPALARIAENVMVEDGVVPRPMLAQAVKRIKKVLEENRLRAGLVFHAGDGNIHPNIVFDQRDKDETKRAKIAGEEILRICLELSGDISGEHGIGVEKRKAMSLRYPQETINLFYRIKKAFDPMEILNPYKKLPLSSGQIKPIDRKEPPLTSKATKIVNIARERFHTKKPSILTSQKADNTSDKKILSSFELTDIMDFDKGNMTITVESGMRISALKKFLKEHNLDVALPLDETTLGAAVALKLYPSMRSLITGMDLLLSSGEVIRLGGKTIKSVSGYNLAPLILGSRGAFAFIISMTLKVYNPAFKEKGKVEDPLIEPMPNFNDPILKNIKKAFDPNNLFNPHVFGEF